VDFDWKRPGESIGQRGFSKDHRPDRIQMIVGAVIDDKGQPIPFFILMLSPYALKNP